MAGFMSTLMASTTDQQKKTHFIEIEHRLEELNKKDTELLLALQGASKTIDDSELSE